MSQTSSADHNSVFIGESLGGFWAAQLAAHFRAHCYLLNPAVYPVWQLQQFIGVTLQTGRPPITQDMCRSFAPAPDPRQTLLKSRIGLMLGTSDTVADGHVTEPYFGSFAKTVDWVSEGHAITNQSSFDLIVSRVNAIQTESALAYAVRRANATISAIDDIF